MDSIHEHAKKIERSVRFERWLKGLLSKILVCIWLGVIVTSGVGYSYLLNSCPKIALVVVFAAAVVIAIFTIVVIELLRRLRNN